MQGLIVRMDARVRRHHPVVWLPERGLILGPGFVLLQDEQVSILNLAPGMDHEEEGRTLGLALELHLGISNQFAPTGSFPVPIGPYTLPPMPTDEWLN